MRPWHDCPKCPGCGSTVGVPRRAADWNHRAKEGDRIVCPACGTGWVGTDAEVAQAESAQQAWEAHESEEMRLERQAPALDVYDCNDRERQP